MTDKIVKRQINIIVFSYRNKLFPLKSVVAKEITTNKKTKYMQFIKKQYKIVEISYFKCLCNRLKFYNDL